MSCPNCDHTMQQVAPTSTYWCPRCGTLKMPKESDPQWFNIDTPKLVVRVREYRNDLKSCNDELYLAELEKLGIVESIYPPDGRYKPDAKEGNDGYGIVTG